MKAYISKSNLVKYDDLIAVRSLLEKYGIETTEYTTGRYSTKPIEDADLIICISYPGAKDGNYIYVGKGIYVEITTALHEGVVVLMYDGGRFFRIKEIKVFDMKDFAKKFGRIEVFPEAVKDISKFLKTIPIREKKEKEEDINFNIV